MATRASETIDVVADGLNPTYHAASAGGDKFAPGDRVFIHIKNGSGASITATIVTPGTVVGQAVGDVTVAVAAAGARFAGPFPRQHFAGSDGLVAVTWSATTSVTFAVLTV